MLALLYTLALATLSFCVPLEEHHVDDRALQERAVCIGLSQVTDTFDAANVIPLLPNLNGVLGPVPTGIYLTYTNMAYANIGTLSNAQPPSLPNDIYVAPSTNNGILTPTFNNANAFKLNKFRYACIAQSLLTAVELPVSCTFQFTCNVYGSSQIFTQVFSFTPDTLLSTTFNTGTFGPEFSSLSQCSINVLTGSLGGLLDFLLTPITILAIDDIEVRGQACFQPLGQRAGGVTYRIGDKAGLDK
ncbi:hypothetical protein JX265_009951 [Neoarthrinium moseri]|uniref:ML-like domain-containing protein n=1 Tax=Neoarthrinium moseri TaxID=1658444 RepID=A0A9Q0AM78_9PEZI|nr:hypothetical protein JX265_009951 [Neoarthrinium moseri]